jgi:hypothetical protein
VGEGRGCWSADFDVSHLLLLVRKELLREFVRIHGRIPVASNCGTYYNRSSFPSIPAMEEGSHAG